MAGIEAIAAIGNVSAGDGAAPVAMQLGMGAPAAARAGEPNFGEVLMAGLKGVDAKVTHAETMAQKFAVDDSVPVHQVTMALAEARVSVELAMQVRARLIEGYRELMNMQL
jgi:flagellar hook-basal body complex protein FliE